MITPSSSRSAAARSQIIAPGATLGVLGSGQLGRMFTIAARRMLCIKRARNAAVARARADGSTPAAFSGTVFAAYFLGVLARGSEDHRRARDDARRAADNE